MTDPAPLSDDRVQAVLHVISGHCPAQSTSTTNGRELLHTYNRHGEEGPSIDLLKLAEDIAGLLDMLDGSDA